MLQYILIAVLRLVSDSANCNSLKLHPRPGEQSVKRWICRNVVLIVTKLKFHNQIKNCKNIFCIGQRGAARRVKGICPSLFESNLYQVRRPDRIKVFISSSLRITNGVVAFSSPSIFCPVSKLVEMGRELEFKSHGDCGFKNEIRNMLPLKFDFDVVIHLILAVA